VTWTKESAPYDYWCPRTNVWFPRCAWIEAHVEPAADSPRVSLVRQMHRAHGTRLLQQSSLLLASSTITMAS
jgi:hypothetical protein